MTSDYIMIFKITAGAVAFRNPQILAVDAKMVTLERVLTNLFMLIYANGAPVKIKNSEDVTIESICQKNIAQLEADGRISGASEYPEAVSDWLRSSLLDLVNRGNRLKESVASLRPIHILSFRLQNKKKCRDYNTADQLYAMLKTSPDTLSALKRYLSVGWNGKNIDPEAIKDVDTAGVMLLTSGIKEVKSANESVSDIKPLLKGATDIFNDDVRRLLAYKDALPRAVFIDYLKILCGFHLAIYTMRVVTLLPKMVAVGTANVEDDWSMVVDLTENKDSKIADMARKDIERLFNCFRPYINATYAIDIVQKNMPREAGVEQALAVIKNGPDQNKAQALLDVIREGLKGKDDTSFDTDDFDELMKFYQPDDYFGKLVHLLEVSNLGDSAYRYLIQFIDAVAMKNSPSMLIADGRTRSCKRRGVLGAKLLETLVQLLVLRDKGDGTFESRPLSLADLTLALRSRYGLIINGIEEPRFAGAGIDVYAAFAENAEALKNRLRQIGFYTDLSDACILQRIRPRYKL